MSLQVKQFGNPILIASHPRSGTHLTIDFLRKQFQEASSWKYWGERLDHLYLPLEALTTSNKGISIRLAEKIMRRSQRPLIKTHADPNLNQLALQHLQLQKWIQEKAHKIYVIRDGRAVMCSYHLYMQSFAPKARCPFSEFIRQEINNKSRVKVWANHVRDWLSQEDIFILKFEELINHPSQVAEKLGHYLSLSPLYSQPLLPKAPQSVWHGRWTRMTHRRPESTAILGYYNGQKTQKWQEAFTQDSLSFFHQESDDLLVELGYNTNL